MSDIGPASARFMRIGAVTCHLVPAQSTAVAFQSLGAARSGRCQSWPEWLVWVDLRRSRSRQHAPNSAQASDFLRGAAEIPRRAHPTSPCGPTPEEAREIKPALRETGGFCAGVGFEVTRHSRCKRPLCQSGGGRDFPTKQCRARIKEGADSDALLADIRSYTPLRLHELVPGRSRQALCASITAEIGDKVLSKEFTERND
jgi:hypothetical protein